MAAVGANCRPGRQDQREDGDQHEVGDDAEQRAPSKVPLMDPAAMEQTKAPLPRNASKAWSRL